MFRDHKTKSFIPKLADFGYSTPFIPHPDQVIRMPISKPWTAPEYHDRGFERSEVFRMDVYSFGMICLWILLYNADYLPQRDFAHDTHADNGTTTINHSRQLLATLQDIQAVKLRLVERVFDLCLSLDANERAQTMIPVMELFSPER